MSAKVHLHLHVSDLGKSREFYEKFLGASPVKVKDGYVKFLPDWAPVNLALSTGGHLGAGTIDHVGVQVDSVPVVMTHLGRVKAAGLPVVGLVDELERAFAKPVVACNAAMYWQALRAIGVDDRMAGRGRLLADL